MIKGILFDLDDTLYPEKQFVMSGFRAVASYLSKKYGMDSDYIFSILKEDFENGLRKRNLDVVLQKLGMEDENTPDVVRIFREHKPTISLYPEVRPILDWSKKRFKLGLITDGYIITQRNKIHSLKIEDYFDVIIINDISKGCSKIDKEPFLKALSEINFNAQDVVYVGDNPAKDFVRAKEIGIHTIRIIRGASEYSGITVDKSFEAEYIIRNLGELPSLISIINRKYAGSEEK